MEKKEFTEEELNLVKPEQAPGHFDVNDDLPDEDIEKAHQRADEKFKKEHDIVLDLEPSTVKVPGQEWLLVSFVGPNCSQKTERLGMKVWGCFANPDDAKEHLMRIGKLEENSMFDIYILQMYTWAIIPPDPDCIEDQEYHDEQLGDLISSHKKEKYRAQEVFDTRKQKLMDNQDVNEYKKNKEMLAKLRLDADEDLEEIKEEDKIQNREAMEKVFGKPEKLPEFKIEFEGEQ